MLRPCLICKKPTKGSRCTKHQLHPYDPRTTTEKGYGASHQRRRIATLLAAGSDKHGIGGVCALCGQPGTKQDPLQADHIIPLSMGGVPAGDLQAMHRSENIAKGGRNRRGVGSANGNP